MGLREKLAIMLLGGGTAWNMGNIGPIVTPIREEFSVSLAAVGVLSGGIVFAALLVATVTAPPLTKRIGAAGGARIVCLCCGVGNIALALAPSFGVALGARAVIGWGAGLAFIFGPAIARAEGGVRLLGIFGASVMVGMAAALGLGGVLQDLGVDWRIAVLLAALIGVLALPLLPAHVDVAQPRPREPGVALRLLRSGGLWRLTLVFLGSLGVPVVVSAWLVYYLSVDGDASTASAGLLSFLVFGLAATMRILGGRLDHRGVPRGWLTGLAPLLAAAGLAALAIEPTMAVALPAAVLMGVGFALPYASIFDQAQRLFPERPVSAISFASIGPNGVPIVLTPLIGLLLAGGLGEAAWLLLAAIVAIGGLANLRPADAVRVPSGRAGRS
jgi:DHA1 family inner membrane transport protein